VRAAGRIPLFYLPNLLREVMNTIVYNLYSGKPMTHCANSEVREKGGMHSAVSGL
jgi:hypothetical protein